jgi:integrase/recombinase XerD
MGVRISAKPISPLRRRMIEGMTIRNLSPTTQRSYIHAVEGYSRYFGRSPDRLGLEDVRSYQVHLAGKGIAWATLNQIVCALRFLYGVTLGQDEVPERIPYARKRATLPEVLSHDEVVRFLEAVPSLKSRVALTTAYATGMRVSEVVAVEVRNIDSGRMVIRIEQSLPPCRRGARAARIVTSCCRRNCSAFCAPIESSPARRGFCFLDATRTAPSPLPSFTPPAARRWRPPALTRKSASTRSGIVLRRICWSRVPISASSRPCSKQRQTAREHPTAGKIHYPFHPRCGEMVPIVRRLIRYSVELVVIVQPDGSLAQIPAWMLHEASSHRHLRAEPRFPLEILRSLRTEVDALLGFLPSDSIMEKDGNDATYRKSPGKPARAVRGRATRRVAVGTENTARNAAGDDVARDRHDAGRRGARSPGGRR